MAPGPLLTYTIAKTLETRRRGFLVGARVIGGHALLESVLVVVLLLGFAVVLKNELTVRVIGILGGGFLIFMGQGILRDAAAQRSAVALRAEAGAAPQPEGSRAHPTLFRTAPLVGGVLVSMSNPYWWVWWATVGFAFMVQYDITFRAWPALLAFFSGHEAGDLAWYVTVSALVSLGKQRINTRAYRIILIVLGIAIVLFGLYLALSPFLAGAR